MATLEQLITIKPKPVEVWDVERIRKDFPVLSQTVHGNPLVYLDNAASSQVPQMVIERGSQYIRQGDEIVISAMEHHANIVPWQMLCEEKNARLRVIPMNDAGELLLDEYDALLNERTKFVAITHVSNALGTV